MRTASMLVVLLLMGSFAAHAAGDITVADFEGDSYGDWKVEGTAFGERPASGTLPGQMVVDGFAGKGLVNSFNGGDGTTGTLTSPPFKIERSYMTFLLGGGKAPGKTCMDLVIDGKVVRSSTGPNEQAGGTERLFPSAWDVSEFKGKEAVIRIVDTATGGWGHINVDDIKQTDVKPPMPVEKKRDLTLKSAYLNFPVKTGAEKRLVRLEVDGKTARQFDIELAEDEPEYWAFLDVTEFAGKKATLRAFEMPEKSKVLDKVEQSDEIKDSESFYTESLRPQFHFTSRVGWLNDPNGLVYQNGEYHLFYQHNPYGWNWGNMHWGHAVSPDLVHWTELPIALYSDALGTMFSGSAVIDTANSLGLNREGKQALVAFYTAAGGASVESANQPFTQCMAYSLDRGRTMTKFEGNPVLGHIVDANRDPKVIRHEPSKRWVMALYLKDSDYALFGSEDLKQWEKLCDVSIPGTSECPEFFEMPVQGKEKETRWVFYGANGGYLVGSFDGKTFTPESGPHMLHHGNAFYAAQTYNNVPDGRRIMVGWGQVAFPGMRFNQQMTFPVELTLRETSEGLRLFTQPAREVETLYGETRTLDPKPIAGGANALEGITGDLLDIDVTVGLGTAQGLKLGVGDFALAYDVAKRELSSADKVAKLEPANGRIQLRVLVDRGTVEVYANNGIVYMPMGSITAEKRALSLTGDGASLEAGAIHTLKSIWP